MNSRTLMYPKIPTHIVQRCYDQCIFSNIRKPHYEPASVAQVTETQSTPTGTVYRRSHGSIPGSAGRLCIRIQGVHALRITSRAGKEGSIVSSIICDRWLILS